MRTKVLVLALALASCGDDGMAVRSDAPVVVTPDAPQFAPVITSLTVSTPTIQANTPTMVAFTWTYLVEPTYPEPACTIDNGVGPVTSGTPVSVTISQQTIMTLTCTNIAGSAQRQVILSVPPMAPTLATFTVSPQSVTPGTVTPLTFTWTYSNSPSPAPTCSIDNGQTTITSGTPVTLATPLTQARTFRLRCSNGVNGVIAYSSGTGGTPADVTVTANECGTAYAQCDPHATCIETPESYTCQCTGSNYTQSGDTCLYTTSTPSDCDTTNCPLVGSTCLPKAGYFGSGQVGDCKRARFTFVTSTSYTSSQIVGLGGADAICTARAAAYNTSPYLAVNGGLPGTYVAWMSSSTDDAYCRVQTDGTATGHMAGKKSANCGQGALPVAAGPWVRVGDWKQWSPTIDKLVAPNHVTYYPANTSDLGAEIASTTDKVWTGTDDTGQYVAGATCADWTAGGTYGVFGEVHGGGQSWTQTSATTTASANLCSNSYHIRCVEVGSAPLPTLPPRHPVAKKVFITSVSGNGYLSMWPDAYGQTGYYAPDAICQARARYAGYANPQTFKAWLAYPNYITNKFFVTASPYARPDGVIIGQNRADLLDSKLAAPWYVTETNQYLAGNADTGNVATNITVSGTTVNTTGTYAGVSSTLCAYWATNSSGYSYYYGRYDFLDYRAFNTQSLASCDQTTVRFLCAEDQ